MEAAVSIKDLVLKPEEAAASAAPAKRERRAEAAKFECVTVSGADFAVRKTKGKSSWLLAFIVSQGQYYVKNERTGDVAPLDATSMGKFASGASGRPVRVGAAWLDDLPTGKKERDDLVAMTFSPDFAPVASSGLWKLEVGCWGGVRLIPDDVARFVSAHPALARSLRTLGLAEIQGRTLGALLEALAEVEGRFGLDCARDFAERYAAGGMQSLSHYRYGCGTNLARDLRRVTEAVPTMPYRKLADYLFDESARQGMARELGDWANLWADCLLMQGALAGKVVDRYPSYLLSYHQVLAAEAAERKAEVDQARWDACAREMSARDLDDGVSPWLVVHPKTPDDMRAEAVAQSNCLASYIPSVLDGAAQVFFLRERANPEAPFVTVEVDPGAGRVVQAKARFNREPDERARGWLRDWCDAVGLSHGVLAAPAR